MLLVILMSKWRKKNVALVGLEPRVSRLPCEHSTTEPPSHTINRLHFTPALLDSSPNLLGTMPGPTRQSLSGCCSQPEHGPMLSHRGGKRTWPDRDSNPGSLAYRASTLPLSYRATRSTGYTDMIRCTKKTTPIYLN